MYSNTKWLHRQEQERGEKMKKRTGFTLIELLAVIVILAVIALISTPLIMNAIDGAQKGAFQNTAYGILEAGKYTYTSEVLKDGKAQFLAFSYENGVQTSNVDDETLNYKGEKPKSGTVLINSNGDMALAIYNGKYCAEKDYAELEVKVSEKTETQCHLPVPLTEVEVLVVAGGGSGGSHYATSTGTSAGGGGAGGLIYQNNYSVTAGTTIDVVVGAGGISPRVEGVAGNGGNSIFGTLEAIGGGTGGYRNGAPTNGGSGGGVGYYSETGGAGTTGQGFSGGSSDINIYGGAGGGGAGAAGQFSSDGNGTNGGVGLYCGDKFGNVFGDNGYFAGGGGGGSTSTSAGQGGLGGGGTGGFYSNGLDAKPNTGSGGGGASNGGYLAGNGGSGIILIRYPGLQRAEGGTVTTLNGYTIHAFRLGTGTFEVIDY